MAARLACRWMRPGFNNSWISAAPAPAAPTVHADAADTAEPGEEVSSLSHGEHAEGAEHEPFTTGGTVDGVDREMDQTVPDSRATSSDMGVIEPDEAGYPGTTGDVAPTADTDEVEPHEREGGDA